MSSQWKRREEELQAQLDGLAERLERTEAESDFNAKALKQARREVEEFRAEAMRNKGRFEIAEDRREKEHEEAEKHKVMVREAMKQTTKYRTKVERTEHELEGLKTDLSTSVGNTRSLQSQLGDLKNVVAKVADQVKDRNDEKADTAKKLIQKMMEFRQLDHKLENARPERLKGEEPDEGPDDRRSEPEDLETFDPFRLPLDDEADEDRHDPNEGRRTPPEPGFLGTSLEAELEQCERRRNLDDDDEDNDYPRSPGGESDTSDSSSWFGSDRARDDSASLTDLSDDETVAVPATKPARLAWNHVDNASDPVSSTQASLPEPKKQEHPEFRLDLLEQCGPRKRVRVREHQDKTLVKEPNPWKGAQKSRLPVALVKDLSRLTLQDKTGKKPAKPSAKQVNTLLKQLPGHSQPERFKPPRPDRFKRCKREKPPARDPSAAVEYTVVVDPAMAENTNMFGKQTPANGSTANQSALQLTQTNRQHNPTGIHGNMFAPEVLAPPVPRTAAPTNANPATTNDNDASKNAPLIHWGPLANPPRPQPVAQPLRKFKPLGPPVKDGPSLPRIVRKNYPGAIYRPMPYGEGSTRLDLPWAEWMTKMRVKQKRTSETPPAQASWDFDFFQRGAGSMDLLPEQQTVLLKWSIAFMCMGLFFILYCLYHNGGRLINDRDLWMEVNDVPGSVFRQMRGPPTLNYRWIDILDYELLRLSGIDRVALG